jgi:hypothetical protein
MALPIRFQPLARDAREELRDRLDKAPLEHAEALLAAYEVLTAFWCQCSSRSPPGWTMTCAAAIAFEAWKTFESTMRTSPAFVLCVGCIYIIRKEKLWDDRSRHVIRALP